jgi:uncharacterized Rossmann fold enzyme
MTTDLFNCRQKERIVVVSKHFDDLEKLKEKIEHHMELKKI